MPHPELEDRLYTSSEVAKLLGVSLRSLYRYIKSSKLKPETTTLSGRHRFSKEQIEKFLYPSSRHPENSDVTSEDEGPPQEKEEPKPTPLERSETPSKRSETPSEAPPSGAESRGERENLEPIADDGEVVKEAEIETAPAFAKATAGRSPKPIPPTPPIPPQEEEKPQPQEKEEVSEEDLEKLRVEALKKVSGEETRHPEQSPERVAAGPWPAKSEGRSEGPPQEKTEAEKKEPEKKEIPPLGHRERVFEVKEEEPSPEPTPPKEEKESLPSVALAKEGSPLNGFSHFDKKCQYFYSPVGDLKQIAQKIHQFASNAGKKYAFTLLAGLSLHQEVPPFSLIHIYLKEPDFAFFKGVLKLIPKSKEEANIGIIFEEDRQFWDKAKTINDYYVAGDKRLRDDLHNYSSETRDLAKEFKPRA